MSTLSNQIRDAMFARIAAAIPFKSARKLPFPPVQPDQVPALGVYLVRESMSPDGDSNVGPPRYIVDAVITVMIIDHAGDPTVLDGSVDAKLDLVENTLLSDPTFLDLRDTATNSPIIDSVPNISRTYQFPKDGEVYYVEARLQFTLRFMCNFQQPTPNDLLLFAATARPQGADPNAPPITVQFPLTPTGS